MHSFLYNSTQFLSCIHIPFAQYPFSLASHWERNDSHEIPDVINSFFFKTRTRVPFDEGRINFLPRQIISCFQQISKVGYFQGNTRGYSPLRNDGVFSLKTRETHFALGWLKRKHYPGCVFNVREGCIAFKAFIAVKANEKLYYDMVDVDIATPRI